MKAVKKTVARYLLFCRKYFIVIDTIFKIFNSFSKFLLFTRLSPYVVPVKIPSITCSKTGWSPQLKPGWPWNTVKYTNFPPSSYDLFYLYTCDYKSIYYSLKMNPFLSLIRPQAYLFKAVLFA